MTNLPRLAITPGEPAGVGPELVARIANQDRSLAWVAIADADLLSRAAARIGVVLTLDERLDSPSMDAGRLTVQHRPLARPETPGRLDVDNAPYVVETLRTAADGCLNGDFAGIVTGPVQKSLINDAGLPFSGHTEYFCERAAAEDVVMLLVAGTLRVALATTHLPLSAVPGAITRSLLERRLRILLNGLQTQFGIEAPTVLVAGLNPHAGESGHLGREEIDVIEPVCRSLAAEGFNLEGPLPADTLFTPSYLARADAVFAMYHDQGLPVLKSHGFGEAVNVTLGLPFVRTSVDHGTALDIAGTGKAEAGSFQAAVRLAERLVS
jgi:4-hydroxythreonine-4-phosphate dehydrogenase